MLATFQSDEICAVVLAAAEWPLARQVSTNVTAMQLRQQQMDNITMVHEIPGPSSAAKPSIFGKINNQSPPVIQNQRPAKTRGLPVTLFHPVFTQFLRNMHNPKYNHITHDYFNKVAQYMTASVDLYPSENDRRSAIRPIIENLLANGDDIRRLSQVATDTGARVDGAIEIGFYCPLVLEEKNEIGTGNTDGTIQVGLGHAKWATQNKVCRIVSRCCFRRLIQDRTA